MHGPLYPMTTKNFNCVNKSSINTLSALHMPQQAVPSTMASTTSWPPSCRSAPSNCTCCCILTPHTHLSDSGGYPHLNHIIKLPRPDTKLEALAWFHCPHCPCTLGLTWIHPKEMPVVEEHVSAATWLPRMADFEGYARLFDDTSTECASPMEDYETPTQTILADRINATNVLENRPSTPVVHRKPPIDGTRKSGRKPKPSPARLEMEGKSPAETPTYKPRKSKYDVR